jgi:hypothetical protein
LENSPMATNRRDECDDYDGMAKLPEHLVTIEIRMREVKLRRCRWVVY